VFHPLITEETLMQEGWHLETEAPETPLTYKGVVFNEMKAYYSTPELYLNFIADRAMWQTAPYRNSSGGFPAAIPELSYEQFKNFHETYYHPSNARFVFSGDDDPEERLRMVNDVISEFERREVDAEIPLETPLSEPKVTVTGYDAGDTPQSGGGTMVRVDWLLPDQSDQQTIIELSVLSHALVATSASPLRKALIDSGLGEGMIGGGLNTSSRQVTFSVGLKGVEENNADKVNALILETLGNLAEEGIDKETVKASLNTIEFNLRERNFGRFPRGLATAMMSMRPWIYGGNPLDSLAFEDDLDALKQRMADDDELLEKLIGKYLLDNSHRSTVIMHPDPQVGKERDEDEIKRLADIKSDMNTDDIKQVITVQEELQTLQQTPDKPEDLAKIPSLTIDDIEREVTIIEQTITEQDGARVYYQDQPTGGIIYFRAGMNLRVLGADLLPYVELFGDALTRMGTENEDFVRLSQRIGSKTGGVGTGTTLSTKYGGDDYIAYLMLSGKTMTDQAQDLLDIVRDALLTVKLDNQERFKQIVLERKVQIERFLALAGQSVAGGRVRAHFTEPAWANELISGTEHLFFLRELVERIDNDWDSVLSALEAVREALVNKAGMVFNITMEDAHYSDFKTRFDDFLTALPSADVTIAEWTTLDAAPYEALTLPAQVNFNAKAANLYELGYELDGSVSVIMKHMSREYMWQNIRVLGGAYGGAMGFSNTTGIVSYLSWRDPNITKTQETFTNAANYLQNLEMSDSDLEKAIIGAIGALDGYDLPDAKGRKAMMRDLLGYTDEMRQQYRDQVLDTTLADFHAMGDVLAKIGEDARVAVVSSP
ncbi:MAG: insulinase family protein, partial [Chloroflexota bacterium]